MSQTAVTWIAVITVFGGLAIGFPPYNALWILILAVIGALLKVTTSIDDELWIRSGSARILAYCTIGLVAMQVEIWFSVGRWEAEAVFFGTLLYALMIGAIFEVIYRVTARRSNG